MVVVVVVAIGVCSMVVVVVVEDTTTYYFTVTMQKKTTMRLVVEWNGNLCSDWDSFFFSFYRARRGESDSIGEIVAVLITQ